MFPIGAFLIAFICHYQVFGFPVTVDQTPLAATCSSETVAQVFASISFIDLISAHDPEFLFELKLPSSKAADIIYSEDLRLFQNRGFRNAEYIAATGAKALSLADEFTIPLYYLKTGTTIGKFLAERGLLSCDNVIETATNYYKNEQSAFQHLDPVVLESYEEAIVTGLQYLLEDLGHTLEQNEVNWQIMVDILHNKYIAQASARA